MLFSVCSWKTSQRHSQNFFHSCQLKPYTCWRMFTISFHIVLLCIIIFFILFSFSLQYWCFVNYCVSNAPTHSMSHMLFSFRIYWGIAALCGCPIRFFLDLREWFCWACSFGEKTNPQGGYVWYVWWLASDSKSERGPFCVEFDSIMFSLFFSGRAWEQ